MVSEDDDLKRADWDRFRYIEPEIRNSHEFVRALTKLLKFFSYIILFAGILFCCVASKISFAWLSSSVNNGTIITRNNESTTALVLALELPYALAFFISTIKAIFGGSKSPKFHQIVHMVFLDCLQAIGVCLIAFNIQSMLDIRTSVLVTSNICLLPIIVAILFSNPAGFWKRGIWKGISCFLGLIQLGITVFFAIKFKSWEIPVGLTFCTIQFWINFVDSESKVLQLRESLEEVKSNTAPFSALFKGLTVLLYPFVFYPDFNFTYISSSNYPLFIQMGSSIVAYYLAIISCRLTMQKFAFSFSLTLSTPIALLLVWLDCTESILDIFRENVFCKSEINWWEYILHGMSWLILLIINSHVWFPNQIRMQKTDK